MTFEVRYRGRGLYELEADSRGVAWTLSLWEDDLDELADMLAQALDGREPEPVHDWRDDETPDEDAADRNAPAIGLVRDAEHRNGWRLAITIDQATMSINLRGLDTRDLYDAIDHAEKDRTTDDQD